MNSWLNKYPIIHDDHKVGLERRAAMNQFHRGMDKEEAEHAAHLDYTRQQQAQAAAFHLNGMKKAKELGKYNDANQHFMMYNAYMGKLGYNVNEPPPPEVLAHNTEMLDWKCFKPHPADSLGFAK